jgi:hypothetical protein
MVLILLIIASSAAGLHLALGFTHVFPRAHSAANAGSPLAEPAFTVFLAGYVNAPLPYPTRQQF